MHAVEIIVPFFIAGLGTCFAGILLDHVQYWEVYKNVEEVLLVVPAILGLKGNLQMTLASRFSTHSHLGHLETREDLFALTCANIALNQCLSVVISLCASFLVTIIQMILSSSGFSGRHTLLIFATTLLTSSVTSFALDLLMIMVVQVSANWNINPDNIAIPLASSLGDMTALMLTSVLGKAFYECMDTSAFYWLSAVVILFYTFLIPVWLTVTQENVHTHNALTQVSHWIPLLVAMALSTLSGIILKSNVFDSGDIALFLPVICGIGGNLVAVQASRLATLLHRHTDLGELPEGEKICFNPFRLCVSQKPDYATSRLLMLIVVPGQIIFYFICIYMNSNESKPSGLFLLLYLVGSQVQVVILIYLAYVLTYTMWTYSMDPDYSAIPYLTSISDVLGACLITLICITEAPTREAKKGERFSWYTL